MSPCPDEHEDTIPAFVREFAARSAPDPPAIGQVRLRQRGEMWLESGGSRAAEKKLNKLGGAVQRFARTC